MRWFKHLSMAHDDAGLSTLVEELGPEAYGIYWLLLEHFAAVMEKDCEAVPALVHSYILWSKICWCSTRKFRKFVDRAAELKLIESRTQAELKQNSSRLLADRVQICIPKLLKYRDEYSRKSGQSPDKLPARSDTDQIQIREESPIVPQGGPVAVPDKERTICGQSADKKQKRTSIQQEFDEEWPGYWLKRGKDTAERAYEKARKQASREEIRAGVLRMGPVLLREAQERGHTPLHPSTWLNRGGWLDEVEPSRAVPNVYPVRDGPGYDDKPLGQIFLR